MGASPVPQSFATNPIQANLQKRPQAPVFAGREGQFGMPSPGGAPGGADPFANLTDEQLFQLLMGGGGDMFGPPPSQQAPMPAMAPPSFSNYAPPPQAGPSRFQRDPATGAMIDTMAQGNSSSSNGGGFFSSVKNFLLSWKGVATAAVIAIGAFIAHRMMNSEEADEASNSGGGGNTTAADKVSAQLATFKSENKDIAELTKDIKAFNARGDKKSEATEADHPTLFAFATAAGVTPTEAADNLQGPLDQQKLEGILKDSQGSEPVKYWANLATEAGAKTRLAELQADGQKDQFVDASKLTQAQIQDLAKAQLKEQVEQQPKKIVHQAIDADEVQKGHRDDLKAFHDDTSTDAQSLITKFTGDTPKKLENFKASVDAVVESLESAALVMEHAITPPDQADLEAIKTAAVNAVPGSDIWFDDDHKVTDDGKTRLTTIKAGLDQAVTRFKTLQDAVNKTLNPSGS